MNIPNNWTEGDIDLGDGLIHYYRAGVKGGPAVVLAHGFSDQGLCWIPTANALAAKYDIIMPDSRGHGRSARVVQGNPYNIVDDLIRVIGALQLEQPILFGHSMGALQVAALAASRPELARALVLIDPPWHDGRPEGVAIMRADTGRGNWDWVNQLPAKSLDQLIVENRREHSSWPEVIVEAFSEGKKLLDQNVLDTTLIPPINLWQLVKGIHCPVLLLVGDPELGGIVTPELSQAVERANPNFTTVRFRNAGHHLNFSQQEAYLAAVQSFVSGLQVFVHASSADVNSEG